MQREIERLLEFRAGLGGSATLLSATLPLSARPAGERHLEMIGKRIVCLVLLIWCFVMFPKAPPKVISPEEIYSLNGETEQ